MTVAKRNAKLREGSTLPPTRPPKPKRGIVLLIVLSLLTLFVLLGISFAVMASKAQIAADINSKVALLGDPLPTETDLVMSQILCDTNARTSLQFHSLLRDLYGDDSVAGVVQGMTRAANAPYNLYPNYDYVNTTLQASGVVKQAQIITFFAGGSFSQIPHYYAGRVLTFTSGAAANVSTRIVDSYFNANNPGLSPPLPAFVFAVEALNSDSSSFIQPSDGDAFLINGAPFNGAGAGYDPQTQNLDAVLVSTLWGSAFPGGTPCNGVDLVALLPHFAGYDMSSVTPIGGPRNWIVTGAAGASANPLSPNSVALGGLDESWDAADLQNMLLAMVPPTAAQSYAAGIPANYLPIIPSLHRPELINFWVNYIKNYILLPAGVPNNGLANVQTQLQIIAYPYGLDRVPYSGDESPFFDDSSIPKSRAQLTRIYNIMHGCIFRPMPWDHPNFTGGNPALSAPLTPATLWPFFNNLIDIPNPPLNDNPAGTDPPPPPFGNRAFYDVDNDGDGFPDSIWIDPGLPVITTRDGRRIKRLAAILVKDLDGSIDLNAHGNLSQIMPGVAGPVGIGHPALTIQKYGSFTGTQVTIGTGTYFAGALGLATDVTQLPKGLGFGPAEVNFQGIFGGTYGGQLAYAQLLSGRYVGLNNAYDQIADLFPTGGGDNNVDARPGFPPMPIAGFSSRDDLSWLKHFGIPNNYAAPPVSFPGWYASPPDVWGRSAISLDYGGQPIWGNAASTTEMIDSPYELALSGSTKNSDSRYTPAQLERLLRYEDPDAMNLDDRLLRLAGTPPFALSPPNPLSTYGSNPLAPGYQSYPYFTADEIGHVEPPGPIYPNNVSHARRNVLAGMTSHIPAPLTAVPQEMRTLGGLKDYLDITGTADNVVRMGKQSILDVYRSKIYTALASAGVTEPALSVRTQYEMLKIIPFEFFRGQKFDINRWLGNGVDETEPGISMTPNGVTDDPAEAGYEKVWPTTAGGAGLPPTQFPPGSPYSSVTPNLPNQTVFALPSAGMDLDGDKKISYTDSRLAKQVGSPGTELEFAL